MSWCCTAFTAVYSIVSCPLHCVIWVTGYEASCIYNIYIVCSDTMDSPARAGLSWLPDGSPVVYGPHVSSKYQSNLPRKIKCNY